ncbi:MAG: LysR family transcriptional regulator [Bacteroidales bacterium]|nr:LysR family transcriptional regulator [Bacteroidales bacterium]MCF8458023.1 LysR family transcriptional regulator [Bacteroidales bacterium]
MEGQKYSNIRVNYRVWFSTNEGQEILGDEDWQLLMHIADAGSLKAAADEMQISYRKAWGDLRDAEQKLGFPLIEKTRGGDQGGSSTLTDEGVRLINAYNELHLNFQGAVEEYIIQFKKTLKGKAGQ